MTSMTVILVLVRIILPFHKPLPWTPSNSKNAFEGIKITLFESITHSSNLFCFSEFIVPFQKWNLAFQDSNLQFDIPIWELVNLCLFSFKLTFDGAISGFEIACTAFGFHIVYNFGFSWKFDKNKELNLELQFLHCQNTIRITQVWHARGNFRDRADGAWRQFQNQQVWNAFWKSGLRSSKCSTKMMASEERDFTSANFNLSFYISYTSIALARQKVTSIENVPFHFVGASYAHLECELTISNAYGILLQTLENKLQIHFLKCEIASVKFKFWSIWVYLLFIWCCGFWIWSTKIRIW